MVSLALVGQCLFMASFSLGAGPCSMMLASELFPLQVRELRRASSPRPSRDLAPRSAVPRPCPQVRGFALGVATLLNRMTSGLVAVSFLSLSRGKLRTV